MPGGGVLGHERPTNGAVRELLEETGLRVSPRDLRLIGRVTYKDKGLNIALVCYYLQLETKPVMTARHRFEVANIKWVSPNRALTKEFITPDTLLVLRLWVNKQL